MISVVTPSYRQLEWLKLCVASVADQTGAEFEHIVQDAGTGSELESWARQQSKLQLFVEKDAGMYDAINRGLARARGEICAYLNCDEQYLPGALSEVEKAFAQDSAIDVVLAGSLVVDGRGLYLCTRPALPPSLRQLRAGNMYNLTSSIFFRRRVVREKGFLFDPGFRILGDLDWMLRMVEAGLRIVTIPFITSAFSDLGTNLALSSGADAEKDRIDSRRPEDSRINPALLKVLHRWQRHRAGHYRLAPFDYAIYTLEQPTRRETFHVEKPTGIWRNRL